MIRKDATINKIIYAAFEWLCVFVFESQNSTKTEKVAIRRKYWLPSQWMTRIREFFYNRFRIPSSLNSTHLLNLLNARKILLAVVQRRCDLFSAQHNDIIGFRASRPG